MGLIDFKTNLAFGNLSHRRRQKKEQMKAVAKCRHKKVVELTIFSLNPCVWGCCGAQDPEKGSHMICNSNGLVEDLA